MLSLFAMNFIQQFSLIMLSQQTVITQFKYKSYGFDDTLGHQQHYTQ